VRVQTELQHWVQRLTNGLALLAGLQMMLGSRLSAPILESGQPRCQSPRARPAPRRHHLRSTATYASSASPSPARMRFAAGRARDPNGSCRVLLCGWLDWSRRWTAMPCDGHDRPAHAARAITAVQRPTTMSTVCHPLLLRRVAC